MANNPWRPFKFGSPEELKSAIDAYFLSTDKNEWMITGLALALNTTRATLTDYQEKDEYADIVQQAKLKIEMAYERRLINRGNAGNIFALKNFGWRDQQNIDHTSNNEKIEGVNITFANANQCNSTESV